MNIIMKRLLFISGIFDDATKVAESESVKVIGDGAGTFNDTWVFGEGL